MKRSGIILSAAIASILWGTGPNGLPVRANAQSFQQRYQPAREANPWAPQPQPYSGPSLQAPASRPPEQQPKPKYYQEPPAAPPPGSQPMQALNAPAGPPRFAPPDLEQRLSTGLPLSVTAPQAAQPYGGAPVAPPAYPVYPAPAPGAGAYAIPGYAPDGYLPAFGATVVPYGASGYPGGYGSYLPPPAGLPIGPYTGRGFAPFGFW